MAQFTDNCYNYSIISAERIVNLKKEFVMKRLFAIIIILVITIQLSACGLTAKEKQSGILKLNNYIDESTTEIKIDADKAYFSNGSTLAFQSKLSVDDMRNSLAESNPDFTFNVIDDKQILMMSKANYPYTLFSKNVIDGNNNSIDDIYVVINESAAGNRNNDKICLPYHLTKKAFVFSEDDGQYSLNGNIHDPYYNIVELQSSPTIFTDIAAFYQDCGYDIEYEGGNTAGGSISVFESHQSSLGSPRPLYRILVMSDGNNRFAMQFCEGTDIYELKAGEAIGNYVESLNKKDSDAFIGCYENVESESVNSFIESVKSCKETSSELFWRDQSREETVIKVHRTLISEDGKQMGSYGTGKVDCTDYWLVKVIDGEPKIICQYENFADTVSELGVYKEFKNHEKDDLVN